MEETQAFENRVLERLNAGKTVRSFLIATVELLTEAVNILVLQVFRKDDYAVKYAVEPLLDGDGPLGDLSVRLKLIYGLGVMSIALPTMRSSDRSASCTASPPCRPRRNLMRAMLNCWQCKSCATSRSYVPQ